jgi:hypothetical protein
MVVLVYVDVLGEVALRCGKACLCCQPSRVLKEALQGLVRRPKLRCERGNVRLEGVRIDRGVCFCDWPRCSEAKPTSLPAERPPSPFLAPERDAT